MIEHSHASTVDPGWRAIWRTFGRIGINSFGGPGGQIGVMHTVLVEEKRWLDDEQFTHALNFCMLLPGPEAMQLATYVGWRLKGSLGGLVAGMLFVVPGAIIMLGLAMLLTRGSATGWIGWALVGLQGVAVALIFSAARRIGRRVLKTRMLKAVALAALLASVLHVPFALVIVSALALGWFTGRKVSSTTATTEFPEAAGTISAEGPVVVRASVRTAVLGTVLWIIPLAVLIACVGRSTVHAQIIVSNVKCALLSFGGAYAALAYAGQQAVHHYQWFDSSTVSTGLSLAETTPGPLVLILEYYGYVAGHTQAAATGLSPVASGLLGAAASLWATFVPCFVWIFAGAHFVERIAGNPRFKALLSAASAAVVGVIVHFGLTIIADTWFRNRVGVAFLHRSWQLPDVQSVDAVPIAVAALASILLWRKWGVGSVVVVSVVIGCLLRVLMFAIFAPANWAD